MDVPITSDLPNYLRFWDTWLTRLVVVGVVIIVELAAIAWKLWRG